VGKAETVIQWRMAIKPDGNEGGRIGIGEIFLTENLESVCSDFVCVWVKAMDEFEAVNVGGMLLASADCVSNWFAEKGKNIQD